jgi:hypothetical protein
LNRPRIHGGLDSHNRLSLPMIFLRHSAHKFCRQDFGWSEDGDLLLLLLSPLFCFEF